MAAYTDAKVNKKTDPWLPPTLRLVSYEVPLAGEFAFVRRISGETSRPLIRSDSSIAGTYRVRGALLAPIRTLSGFRLVPRTI